MVSIRLLGHNCNPVTLCEVAHTQVSTAFFASLPGGKPLFWPMFVVITAASIVASQALISASYQIVAQVRHPFSQ